MEEEKLESKEEIINLGADPKLDGEWKESENDMSGASGVVSDDLKMGDGEKVRVLSDDLIGNKVGEKDLMAFEKESFDSIQFDPDTIDGIPKVELIKNDDFIGGPYDNAEKQMGGGASNDLAEALVGEKEEAGIVGEKIEQVGVTTWVGDETNTAVDAENPIGIVGEKVIAEEVIRSSVLKLELEVMSGEGERINQLSDGVGDVSTDLKCDHSDDKSVATEGTGPTIMDENISVGISKSPELDENVNHPDNTEAVVEGEHPDLENKMETEVGAELELAAEDLPELQLDDGDMAMELESQVVVDKGLDEAAKMESDLDEPGGRLMTRMMRRRRVHKILKPRLKQMLLNQVKHL